VNFTNIPATLNKPYTAFPEDFRTLPTVSFVIPSLCHDMHDCPEAEADAWLKKELASSSAHRSSARSRTR
jgi:acid phosphatase